MKIITILSLCFTLANSKLLWPNQTLWANATQEHIDRRANTAINSGNNTSFQILFELTNYFILNEGSSKNDVMHSSHILKIYVNFVGDGTPLTPNPWGPRDTPRSPDPNEDYTADYHSLYSILTQIDKAIHENDKRPVFGTLNLQLKPMAPCDLIYEDQYEQQMNIASRIHSSSPVLSVSDTAGLAEPPFSPDFIFIKENDCSKTGVRDIIAAIQVRISRYLLSFTELERYRDNLARVNDVFGGQIGQVARDLQNLEKLERSRELYMNAKLNIEGIMNSFLSKISSLNYEIRKMVQELIGRKMGWGYKKENPTSHFLMILRQRSLSIFQPVEPASGHIPDILLPDNVNKPRHFKRSIAFEPTNFSCIKNIASLDELAWAITTRANESVQIYALREDTNILDLQIVHLRNIFHSWLYTGKGWYNTYWYAEEFNKVMNLYEYFEHKILRNETCSTIPTKKMVINNFINNVIGPEMTTSLRWYYDPTGGIKRIRDFMVDNIGTLSQEQSTLNLKVPQF
jgi:hypothetical protein